MGARAAAQGSGSSGWFHPFPYLKNGDVLPALLIGGLRALHKRLHARVPQKRRDSHTS